MSSGFETYGLHVIKDSDSIMDFSINSATTVQDYILADKPLWISLLLVIPSTLFLVSLFLTLAYYYRFLQLYLKYSATMVLNI